jgi:hypothetical protein
LDDDFNTIALKLGESYTNNIIKVGLNGRVPDRDFFLNINHLLIKAEVEYFY